MRILKQGVDIDEFFSRVQEAGQRLLMLDYDGTLAPFCLERDKAIPYEGVREVLESISAAGGTRLVIISGRSTEDVAPLLGISHLPEIWGCHGWERRMADGTYHPPELATEASAGLAEAARWAADAGFVSELERKAAGVAVHLRGMAEDEAKRVLGLVLDGWGPIAARSGLHMKEFNIGLEIRPPDRDKGFAVGRLLEECGADTVSAYLGDDLTDEDAFVSLGSRGLSVLVRDQERRSAAGVWIRPPKELLAFLERWHQASGGNDER